MIIELFAGKLGAQEERNIGKEVTMKMKRAIILLLPIFSAILSVVFLADFLKAAEYSVEGNGDQLVVVADTTATMGPELKALYTVFPGSHIADDQVDRDFHLVVFTDVLKYKGRTNNVNQFRNWLSKLEAEGGGDCEDAMLQALAGVARGAPDSRALVLSDAAPQGGRSNLAFIMNRLVERGVNIYPQISGWCNDSELSQAAMFSLARMTGGVATIHEEDESGDVIASTMDQMALRDTVLVENAALDGVEIYPLTLDSTATTLGVEDKPCKPTW